MNFESETSIADSIIYYSAVGNNITSSYTVSNKYTQERAFQEGIRVGIDIAKNGNCSSFLYTAPWKNAEDDYDFESEKSDDKRVHFKRTKELIMNTIKNSSSEVQNNYAFLRSKKNEYLKSLASKSGRSDSDNLKLVKQVPDYLLKLIHKIYPSSLLNFYKSVNKRLKEEKFKLDFKLSASQDNESLVCDHSDVPVFRGNNFFNIKAKIYLNLVNRRTDDDNFLYIPVTQNESTINNLTLLFDITRNSRLQSENEDCYCRNGIYESIRFSIHARNSKLFSIRFVYVDPRIEWMTTFKCTEPDIATSKLGPRLPFDVIPCDRRNRSEGIGDDRLMNNRSQRNIIIVSNKPLFTPSQLQLCNAIVNVVGDTDRIQYNSSVIDESERADYIDCNQSALWLHQILLKELWFDPECSVQKLLHIANMQCKQPTERTISRRELNDVQLFNDYYRNHPFFKGLPKLIIHDPNDIFSIETQDETDVPLEAWFPIFSNDNRECDHYGFYPFKLSSKLNNVSYPIDLENQSFLELLFNSGSYRGHLSYDDQQQLPMIRMRFRDYIDECNLKVLNYIASLKNKK